VGVVSLVRQMRQMDIKQILSYVAMAGVVFVIASSSVSARELVWDFENGAENWSQTETDKGSISVALAPGEAGGGKQRLAITGNLPRSFGAKYRVWDNWRGYTTLSFDIKMPASAPKDLDLFVHIKDKQYYWYQAAPLHDKKTDKRLKTLPVRQWSTIVIDVSEDSTDWQPGSHERSWGRVLYYPREFGFRFFSAKAWKQKRVYPKPFLFVEYGPQTVSLPISAEKWQQDFRTGMWVSYMIPSAAPGQFWYHRA